jgi:hypothetical protein
MLAWWHFFFLSSSCVERCGHVGLVLSGASEVHVSSTHFRALAFAGISLIRHDPLAALEAPPSERDSPPPDAELEKLKRKFKEGGHPLSLPARFHIYTEEVQDDGGGENSDEGRGEGACEGEAEVGGGAGEGSVKSGGFMLRVEECSFRSTPSMWLEG